MNHGDADRLDPAENQHRADHESNRRAPEQDVIAAAAFVIARAVDRVDDQDRAVRRGHQIGHQQNHHEPRHHKRQPRVEQHGERRRNNWSDIGAPRMRPPASPDNSSSIAVPPTSAIQTKHISEGTIVTPKIYSRIVRPREMRAMNMPTKGAKAIHHAQ